MSRRSFRKLSRGGEVESQKAWGKIEHFNLVNYINDVIVQWS